VTDGFLFLFLHLLFSFLMLSLRNKVVYIRKGSYRIDKKLIVADDF